jgi:uncharacterized protein (TIGR02246 family)
MALTKADVIAVLDVYMQAWQTQDQALILTIFTEDATYHERVLQAPMVGHEAIRRYWETKVAAEQANIECGVWTLYLDGDTAIAEWDAEFDDLTQGVRKHMKEIAVLELVRRDGRWLISSLREYWSSEATGQPSAS